MGRHSVPDPEDSSDGEPDDGRYSDPAPEYSGDTWSFDGRHGSDRQEARYQDDGHPDGGGRDDEFDYYDQHDDDEHADDEHADADEVDSVYGFPAISPGEGPEPATQAFASSPPPPHRPPSTGAQHGGDWEIGRAHV